MNTEEKEWIEKFITIVTTFSEANKRYILGIAEGIAIGESIRKNTN